MRASASVASSSPAPSPVPEKPAHPTRGSKRKKAQVKNMAGLVAGDSDSSALTQESGDESHAPTPTTNPDGGTEYAEGDGEREQSSGMYYIHVPRYTRLTPLSQGQPLPLNAKVSRVAAIARRLEGKQALQLVEPKSVNASHVRTVQTTFMLRIQYRWLVWRAGGLSPTQTLVIPPRWELCNCGMFTRSSK